MTAPIVLPAEIGEGKARESKTVFQDAFRRLVLIRLRNEEVLPDHAVGDPITIQALHGKGTLNVAGRDHPLTPGVVVPLDAGVVHHVRPEPALALLVTFLRQPDARG